MKQNSLVEIGLSGASVAATSQDECTTILPHLLRHLKSQSWKRVAFARGLHALSRLGLMGLATRPALALDDTFQRLGVWDWLATLEQELGWCGASHLFIYPPQGIKRRRIYALHIARDGALGGFSKIGFDTHNNARIEHEGRVLRELRSISCEAMSVPVVMQCGAHDDIGYLTIEPLPRNSVGLRNDGPSYKQAISIYAGAIRETHINALLDASWGRRYLTEVAPNAAEFHRELISRRDDRIAITRTHGDPGPHNFRRSGDRVWVIDWEDSHCDAPARADEIGLRVGLQTQFAMKHPTKCLKSLMHAETALQSPPDRLQLMAALAYRAAVGHPDAARLVQSWRA